MLFGCLFNVPRGIIGLINVNGMILIVLLNTIDYYYY